MRPNNFANMLILQIINALKAGIKFKRSYHPKLELFWHLNKRTWIELKYNKLRIDE